MSTTEADYRALTDGAEEAIYLRCLLQEMELSTAGVYINFSKQLVFDNLSVAFVPTQIDLHLQCNNLNAIKLACNPIFHARSKHIKIHHHYVR